VSAPPDSIRPRPWQQTGRIAGRARPSHDHAECPATRRLTGLCLPKAYGRAGRGLKFDEALRARLAETTLAVQMADEEGAGEALVTFTRWGDFPRGAISRRARGCLSFIQS
jgi:hypothetical protein